MPTLAEEIAVYAALVDTAAGALVDDAPASRMIAAWSTAVLPPWEPPTTPRPDDVRARWPWLWQGVGYDVVELCAAANLAPADGHRIFHSLVALRLLYPDGTISDGASALLTIAFERALERATSADAIKPGKPARRGR